MQSQDFPKIFELLTGHPPFPWQIALYNKFVAGEFPTSANIPTGLGKTSIVAIWLIALTLHPDRVPRRLVYVVNRRTVVDQTTTEVEKLRDALADKPELKNVLERLRALCAIPLSGTVGMVSSPLAISTLRGQFADNREWSADPARPAVVIGTVDMIGSGLLFHRYTAGFKLRPHHAAFLAQDALLVHDEAHLEPAFQNLLETIVAEQARANDPRKLRVIALTATSRNANQPEKSPFGLTEDDKKSRIEDGIEQNVVLHRLHATKRLRSVGVAAEKDVRAEIIRFALQKKDTGRAVLIFVRSVEAAEKIVAELSKNKGIGERKVAMLTGTLRGKERDKLVSDDAVFQRFLPLSSRSKEVAPAGGTVYLVATSAGEVGVNLSAADLICDLSTYESMAQRFGRVNRFGENPDSTIVVVHAEDMQTKYDEGLTKAKNAPKDAAKKVKAYEEKYKITVSWLKTLELLRSLAALNDGVGDASSAALDALPATDRAAAFSPLPEMRIATAVQFDVWALTSIREPLAARPPVAPYLHGEAEWEPPETHVAWRDETEQTTGESLKAYPPEELLEDFPLKPRELLRDTSGRVFDRLVEIAESLSKSELNQLNGWLVLEEGTVEIFPLRNLLADDSGEASDANEDDSESDKDESNDASDTKAAKDTAKRRKDRIVARLADRTLILPPSFGGLSRQGFLAATDAENAVNRDHLDVSTDSNRKREWRDTPEIPADLSAGFRLVRVIDSQLGSEDSSDVESSSEAGDPPNSDATPNRGRYWLWLETKTAVGAERRYSSNSGQPETLAAHTGAVVGHARAIAEKAFASPVGSSRGDTPDLSRCLVLAARCHDLGKNRRQWQLGIGNFNFDSKNPDTIFAKSGGNLRPRLLAEHYRHEFGSLADITTAARAEASIATEFGNLPDLEQDIVLHLVAAHHGRARPQFPSDEIFDYLSGSPQQSATLATEIPRRFARLQRHFGRWGLAWLESLLRAADYAASSGIAPQNGAETAISPDAVSETTNVSPVTETTQQPVAEISLHLNPANPGHYFACCGLFELAAALAPDARAWFAEDGSAFHIAATGFSLKELLEKITAAEIASADEEANAEARDEGDEEESEEDASTPPLRIGTPFRLRLDWWNTATANTSALKVWAGSMDVLSIARSMSYTIAQTLSSARAVENILFETCVAYDPSKVENNKKKYASTYEKAAQKAEEKRTEALNKAEATKSGEKLEKEKSQIASRFKEDLLKAKSKRDSADPLKDAKKEPFYFDANRGPNAHSRDVGFATNDLKWETLAAPAVELLTLVGLQRATPAPVPKMPRNFDYHLWTRPLPVSLLSAAVNGLLPDSSLTTFRFESWFRTGQRKHKAFIAARTIPAR